MKYYDYYSVYAFTHLIFAVHSLLFFIYIVCCLWHTYVYIDIFCVFIHMLQYYFSFFFPFAIFLYLFVGSPVNFFFLQLFYLSWSCFIWFYCWCAIFVALQKFKLLRLVWDSNESHTYHGVRAGIWNTLIESQNKNNKKKTNK